MSQSPEPKKFRSREIIYLVVGLSIFIILGSIFVVLPMISRSRKIVVQNNFRQICLACANYESARMELPSNAPPRGKETGLSWRVKILPYIDKECGNLFAEFNHKEPWDSPHNKKLIAKIPKYYQHPSLQSKLPEGHTVYQMPISNPEDELQAIQVEGRRGRSYRNIPDGAPHTILVLETSAESAVPWTKPVDWKFDASNPKKNLGDGGINIGMCDASVHFLPTGDISDELFVHMITPADGKIVQRLKQK